MVYYFVSKRDDVEREVVLYMGKHKEESKYNIYIYMYTNLSSFVIFVG